MVGNVTAADRLQQSHNLDLSISPWQENCSWQYQPITLGLNPPFLPDILTEEHIMLQVPSGGSVRCLQAFMIGRQDSTTLVRILEKEIYWFGNNFFSPCYFHSAHEMELIAEAYEPMKLTHFLFWTWSLSFSQAWQWVTIGTHWDCHLKGVQGLFSNVIYILTKEKAWSSQ